MMNEYSISYDGELYHWGVKGMKWGIRRYQNKDGSLTPEGKRRLGLDEYDSYDTDTVLKKVRKLHVLFPRVDTMSMLILNMAEIKNLVTSILKIR